MYKLEMTQDIRTGIEHIDRQHEELFTQVNALLEASNVGAGPERIGETYGYLADYVTERLSDEEALQKDIGYPGIYNHKSEHNKFIEELSELRAELRERGPSLALVIKTNGMVTKWLLQHVNSEDRDLAYFIRSRAGQ